MGKLIGELLVEAKALTREKLDEVLKLPREAGKKLGQILIERGYVSEAQLTQTLSFQLSVPWVSLYHIDFSRQLLSRVPREIAERHCLVPIYVRHVKGSGDTLYVAIEDPTNQMAMVETSKAAGLPVRPMIASPTDIQSAIRVYYGTPNEVESVPMPPAPAPATTPDRPQSAPDRKPEPPPLPPKRKPNAEPVASAGGQGSAALAQLAGAPQIPNPPPSRPVPTPPDTPREKDALDPEDPSDSPDASPEVEAREIAMPGRRGARMVALTLLDGTSLKLPARPRRRSEPPPGGVSDQLTSRDLISALRALSHGADVSEILGENVHWEAMFAALLSVMLKKGIIADWEFVEELQKI